ncbi:MAG: enoyl-CoA hydratase/isomerase family protein [Calditerrivibrio sp.]|nr:enoyl-CoA hydratase/isomerase family protein [Calditerrivibrio sp.]
MKYEKDTNSHRLDIILDGTYLTKDDIIKLITLLKSIEKDRTINHIVFSSDGENFCLGHDINEILHYDVTQSKIYSSLGQELLKMIRRSKKIFHAALTGKALGPGFELVLATDLIFGTKGTTFGFPETTFGILPAFGGTSLTSRKIHENFAKFLTITGNEIDIDELFCRGIVSKIFTTQKEMFSYIEETITNLNEKSIFTLGLAKETINNGIEIDLERALLLEQNAFAVAFSSYDKKEGMGAFVDKRKPHFKNRWEDYEEMF